MKRKPFVTLVMPVRKEASFIARSLNSVLTQDYHPYLLEVFVADGMSNDLTRDEIRSMQARHRNLRLLITRAKIVPAGKNLAIEQARGPSGIRPIPTGQP